MAWAALEVSEHAKRTLNPLRNIVDKLKRSPNETKSFIALSIGDPTLDGEYLPPDSAITDLCHRLVDGKANGYPPSVGNAAARAAVAEYWCREFAPGLADARHLLTAERVVLASGASHALLMVFTALCNPGDTLLLPAPCFSLYGTICESYGIHVRHYRCDPARNWEACIDDIVAAAAHGGEGKSKVKAILINNPSNPCGSNFSRAHVAELLRVADELRLPVIADEIYAGLVFGDEAAFSSVADFDTAVPRFIVGGTAKNFAVPGWRMGWLLLADRDGAAAAVLDGVVRLSTLLVGPNSPVQAALPSILNETPAAYAVGLRQKIARCASVCHAAFQHCPGLKPTLPQGAMYMMLGIDTARLVGIDNDIAFAQMLMAEENVQVLPGAIFQLPNYFRIVITKPIEVLEEAARRIQAFCERHCRRDA